MSQKLSIVIPMAGLGTRLRPHTWSKPKPLVRLAGQTVLDHALLQFETIPDSFELEYIFVVGPQGDQIQKFMDEHHPDKTVHYVTQAEMRGQSDAIYQAKDYLDGPMLMVFSDTLIETDLSFLADEPNDGVAWVKAVEDPRRFGVVELGQGNQIVRLIEKPDTMQNNLAVVGFYYFKDSRKLISAIEEQVRLDLKLKGEYFLADAINLMLKADDFHFRTEEVSIWLDAGTPDALLDTNHFLLKTRFDNSQEAAKREGVTIIPPVLIHESAVIESSIIGPNATIGADCRVSSSIIRNAILEEEVEVDKMILEDSLIGRQVKLEGNSTRLNLGDQSWAKRE
jgi:glucose-1-phosphate thymidylyltransferase